MEVGPIAIHRTEKEAWLSSVAMMRFCPLLSAMFIDDNQGSWEVLGTGRRRGLDRGSRVDDVDDVRFGILGLCGLQRAWLLL